MRDQQPMRNATVSQLQLAVDAEKLNAARPGHRRIEVRPLGAEVGGVDLSRPRVMHRLTINGDRPA